MATLDEIINRSEENVQLLATKLIEFDILLQNIEDIKKQPEVFQEKFKQVIRQAEEYTDALGAATKSYLDGNNALFTEKLKELSVQSDNLRKEIGRLISTDFNKLFETLQKIFIEQTRKDIDEELKKIDEKSQSLQIKINELKAQVERLEKIDLEKHFDKLQKTLFEIFGAINSINLILTSITQSLNGIVHILGTIQNTIESNHKETRQIINSFSETIEGHLNDQDKQFKKDFELLENKIKSLAEQNEFLKKQVKTNRIIQIAGIIAIIAILIFIAIKSIPN